MVRNRALIILPGILILLTISFVLVKYYPILEACYYNKEVSVSGVKFLMSEDELKKTLEKGEFVYGMGGNGWRFSEPKVFVMTSSLGLFKNKVAFIETGNKAHSILGIRVGDDYRTALAILKNKGFVETSKGFFTKGNVQVNLLGVNYLSKLRIGIRDPAYKDVVF